MRSPTLMLACAATLTLACGDGGGGGGSDIEPRSGTWNFMGSDPVDDTCNYEDLYTDPPGQFDLTHNGDGTFTVDDGTNVFDCDLDGATFSCPERAAGENDVGAAFNIDAVVTFSVSVTGSFSSDTQMSGRQLMTVVCEGADCGTVEDVVGVTTPCGWAQDFTASAQ
ncbi:MAG: hypothetical protein R6X02_30525 [Enhygromyxa sp.]